ncbi:MAG TPA: DUF2442 domain-containing protein [Oscillatoriaceae cyanobacterium]
MGTASNTSIPDDFDAQYQAAIERGRARRQTDPYAVAVSFDAERREYFIRLQSGESFGIPIAKIPELAGAGPKQLADVDLFAQGEGLRWDALDLDITTLTLVNRAFGEVIRRALGKQAGSARTPAKAAAAKANGSKGGRPKGSKNREAL